MIAKLGLFPGLDKVKQGLEPGLSAACNTAILVVTDARVRLRFDSSACLRVVDTLEFTVNILIHSLG